MGQDKQSKIEENRFFTTSPEQNSYSILKPKIVSKIIPIIQPKVGPHTAVWGNNLKKEKPADDTSAEVQAKMENGISADKTHEINQVNLEKEADYSGKLTSERVNVNTGESTAKGTETTEQALVLQSTNSIVEYYVNNGTAMLRDLASPSKPAKPQKFIPIGTKVIIASTIENTSYVKVVIPGKEESVEMITSLSNLTKVEKVVDDTVYRGSTNSIDSFTDPFNRHLCGKLTMENYFTIKEKCGSKVHIYWNETNNTEYGWVEPNKLLLRPKDLSKDFSSFEDASDWTTLDKLEAKELAVIEKNRDGINDHTDVKTYGKGGGNALTKSGKGHVYNGKNVLAPDINGQSVLDTKIQKLINKESEKEGGFSSINTWDGEAFTYGRGFASGGTLLPVLKDFLSKSPENVSMFRNAGIAIVDGQLMVVGKDGTVHKKNAASQIASDTRLLSFFIEIGENKSYSKDMIDSEYKELSKSLKCPDYCMDKVTGVFKDNWNENTITILAHLSHWAGAGWNIINYSDTKGDLNQILYKYISSSCASVKPMRTSYSDSNYIWNLSFALPSRLEKFGTVNEGEGLAVFKSTWGDNNIKEISIDATTKRIKIIETGKFLKGAILFKEGAKYRIIIPVGDTLDAHITDI